jgi:serine/threonine protein kinase
LSLACRIDDACNRFEAAWKVATATADAPRLEDFLTDTVEPDRSALLKELLPIDVFHRRRLGESPRVETYQERFAGMDTLVIAHALGDTTINDTPGATSTGTPGERRLGDYQVLSELGRGGMGAVLLARDPHVKREVAIKVLLANHEQHPELVRRFFAEARIGGHLQHPGVVPVYELSRTDAPRPYFTMKPIEGRSLATLLAERQSPDDDLPRFLRVFQQITQTMAYAHSRGIVHRDLKPANVMVGDFGETLVVDWGLAKRLEATPTPEADGTDVLNDRVGGEAETYVPTGSATDELTGEGRILGTLRYMSPEQATGASARVGPATDVYALGAILYEIVAGRPPYHDLRGPELLTSVQQSAPKPITHWHRTAAKPLVAICARAMARRPEDRYATATTLARDVERWLADEPVSVYADPWTVRARRWTRRHPAMSAAVLAPVRHRTCPVHCCRAWPALVPAARPRFLRMTRCGTPTPSAAWTCSARRHARDTPNRTSWPKTRTSTHCGSAPIFSHS